MKPVNYAQWRRDGLPRYVTCEDNAIPIVWSSNASDKRIKDRLVEHIVSGQQEHSGAIPATNHDILRCEACGAIRPQELIQFHSCEKSKGFIVFYPATPMQVADWLDKVAVVEFRLGARIGEQSGTQAQ